MRRVAWVAALALLSGAARADAPSPECLAIDPKAPSPAELDWSDGQFRVCAPLTDAAGKAYAADVKLVCVLYLNAAIVHSARLSPGELMTGPHGLRGDGIATGLCSTDTGLASELLEPVDVKLTPLY